MYRQPPGFKPAGLAPRRVLQTVTDTSNIPVTGNATGMLAPDSVIASATATAKAPADGTRCTRPARCVSAPSVQIWSPGQKNMQVVKPEPQAPLADVSLAEKIEDIEIILASQWVEPTMIAVKARFGPVRELLRTAANGGFPFRPAVQQKLLLEIEKFQHVISTSLQLVSLLRRSGVSLKMQAGRITQENLFHHCSQLARIIAQSGRTRTSGSAGSTENSVLQAPWQTRPGVPAPGASPVQLLDRKQEPGSRNRLGARRRARSEASPTREKRPGRPQSMARPSILPIAEDLSVSMQAAQILALGPLPSLDIRMKEHFREGRTELRQIYGSMKMADTMLAQYSGRAGQLMSLVQAALHAGALHLNLVLAAGEMQPYREHLLELFNACARADTLLRQTDAAIVQPALCTLMDLLREQCGKFFDHVDRAVFDDLDRDLLREEAFEFVRECMRLTMEGQESEKQKPDGENQPASDLLRSTYDQDFALLRKRFPVIDMLYPGLSFADVIGFIAGSDGGDADKSAQPGCVTQ